MSIIRVVKEDRKRFIITHTEPILNQELSWSAKGMLLYLMTKPENWQVTKKDLINASPAGKAKVQTIINELKAAGYMRRFQVNDPETGEFVTITDVFETITLNPDRNPKDTPIYGGLENTVTRKSVHGIETVTHFTVDGKPGHIVNIEEDNIYKGDVIKNHEHDSDSIPGAYTEPPFEQINEMVSFLSGVCKGFVNVLQPEDCEFYKAAVILIEQGIDEEAVRAFGPWWEKNGYYQGKPAVKSLLMEIGNSIKGIKIDQLNKYQDLYAARSWKECNQWITRDIKVNDFEDPFTLKVIQQIGESTMRQLSKDNSRQIKTLYFDLYGDLVKQNGA